MIAQGVIMLGGPAVGLVTINDYPFLIEDRTLYGSGLASIVFWFLASFAIFRKKYFPKGMPPLLKLPFRAGFGLCMSSLLLGAAGIVNGYGMPLVSRDVAVVSKHTTRDSDPARRTYYLAIRAWPPSAAVVELGAPRGVYDRIDVPLTAIGTPQQDLEAMRDGGHVRLVVGEGRLGLEWPKTIEPADYQMGSLRGERPGMGQRLPFPAADGRSGQPPNSDVTALEPNRRFVPTCDMNQAQQCSIR